MVLKKIIISVTNDLSTDQRVDKVSNTLLNFGFSVLLIGRIRDRKKSINFQTRRYDCYRFQMYFKKGFFFYMEYNLRLFFFLLKTKSDLLLSNDLDTLPANFLISKIFNRKLVYDSHEVFTEVPELIDRPLVKSIWLLIEKTCLPNIKYTYTVSDSMADYYNKKYGINMSVIKNVPLSRTGSKQKKKHDFFDDSKVKKILYQGAVNKDRGIKLMISSMLYVSAKLYIVGTGDILDYLINYTKDLNLEKKVIFVGKVDFKDLFFITEQADLGLSLEKDTCISYRYSLPNKIFDYINAEIPVLVSDLPEFRKVVQKYKIGSVLSSREPQEVADQINFLLSVSKNTWKKRFVVAKKDFCWTHEQNKLSTIFSSFLT